MQDEPGDVIRLPGVSAQDAVTTVRVHLDRVHDAVRRLGCDEAAAVEVVETSAMDLVEALADAPDSVADRVGWWFARARDLAVRVGDDSGALPVGSGLLSVDEDQGVLAEALEALPERERAALLLRDSYDLPAASVGAALGLDAASAMDLVGRARLAFLPFADDEPPLEVPAHSGSLGALARVAEGGPVAPPDATPRRHAMSCEACRSVLQGQQRAHLLLSGLAVVALREADRAAVLGRVEPLAHRLLPSEESLLVVEDELEVDEDRWLLSPLLALLGLLLATALGVGAGLLLSALDDDALPPEEAALNLLPPVTAAPAISPAPLPAPPATGGPKPRTSVFVVPDPTTAPPAPPPPPPPSPTAAARIRVTPTSGPDGARVTVTGAGWSPGAPVTVDYLGPDGQPTGSTASATADDEGRFSTALTLRDPSGAPGRHAVRATDGTSTATAPYDVTA